MVDNMKVSIITVVLNNKDTIEDCMLSVFNQSYPDIEYIVIDGGSIDGTTDIIKKYESKIAKWVSEPDRGIYDAMNKGIKLASGDIIGILNSDDFYAHGKVIERVVSVIERNQADSCYGDLIYVDRYNPDKVIRYWKSKPFNKNLFKKGWMPPHPTFFCRKSLYEKYGLFKEEMRIAADYEMMLRLLYKFECSTVYIPEVLVKMRGGGNSRPSFYNTMKANRECYRAWRINGLDTSILIYALKPLSKINQYLHPSKKLFSSNKLD